jgi:hypothetical protein
VQRAQGALDAPVDEPVGDQGDDDDRDDRQRLAQERVRELGEPAVVGAVQDLPAEEA